MVEQSGRRPVAVQVIFDPAVMPGVIEMAGRAGFAGRHPKGITYERKHKSKPARYGMAIDLDRCTGCGACMIACAVENNVPPARPEATPRTGITWMRVYQISNGAPFPENRAAFIPMLCQQCGQRYAVRLRLPAAGRGGRPRHRHRGPDAAALPGLPLLHDGLPVSRALLQLVGSRSGRPAWRRR